MAKLRFSAVFDYPNNHATVTIDEMSRKHGDMHVGYFYWHGFPEFRKDNDWAIPNGATHLNWWRPASTLLSLFKLLRRTDVVYFQSFSSPRISMPMLLLAFLLFGRPNRILIASEGMKKRPSWFTRLLVSRLFNTDRIIHLGIGHNASQNFVDAGMTRWECRKFCFNERYRVQPGELSQRRKTDGGDDIVVLCVGQLIERKGHHRLISALAESKHKERIRLVIAGDGPLRADLERHACELNVASRVLFSGFCDRDQLHKHFLNADIFALMSRYDGWGVVVNQAVAYGLPLILWHGVRAGRDFLLEPERNGYVCGAQNEVVEALDTLVNCDSTRISFGMESERVSTLWNIDTTSERLADFINDQSTQFECGPLSPAVIGSPGEMSS